MFVKLKKIAYYLLIISALCSLFILGLKNAILLVSTFVVASTMAVFIHELGHYIVSLLLGNKPKYFIVGTTLFGLKFLNGLIKFKIKETKFILNPLGQSGSLETFTYMNKIDEWKMILISVSGPIFNLLSGIFVLSLEVNFIKECIDNRTTLNLNDTIHVFLIFGFLFCSLFYFVGNLLNITSTDGWFANQLIKKYDERDEQFFDFKIHKLHDYKLVDKKSYKTFIEPLYDNYNELYEIKNNDTCICSELKYYYYSFLAITLGTSLFVISIILDCIPALSYEITYVQRAGGILIVLGIIVQFFLLAIRRRVINDNVVELECGPEETKTYRTLNITSYIFMIVGTIISSYYDLCLHIIKTISELLKYI